MAILKRLTKVPNSPLRIQSSIPDGGDAGLAAGGTYFFMPAGEEGSAIDVPDHVAETILADPGLAAHFVAPAAAADPSKTKAASK